MNYEVINILDMIDSVGEDTVNTILSEFSCSQNKETENFLKTNAVLFAKKKISITYLVYSEDGNLAAIFTLAHKTIDIEDNGLSENARKKLRKYSRFTQNNNTYSIPAFLIGQFGKNDSYPGENISGADLMNFTLSILLKVQHDIGGSIVYLDCEENEKLINFYIGAPNLFRPFGNTFSESEETRYIQLLRFI